jgi:hypothetical protein
MNLKLKVSHVSYISYVTIPHTTQNLAVIINFHGISSWVILFICRRIIVSNRYTIWHNHHLFMGELNLASVIVINFINNRR